MAIGLQNCVRTGVMAKQIYCSRFYEFPTERITEIGYSLIYITVNVTRDNVFTSLLQKFITLSSNVFESL
jgi:hypothetical protein